MALFYYVNVKKCVIAWNIFFMRMMAWKVHYSDRIVVAWKRKNAVAGDQWSELQKWITLENIYRIFYLFCMFSIANNVTLRVPWYLSFSGSSSFYFLNIYGRTGPGNVISHSFGSGSAFFVFRINFEAQFAVNFPKLVNQSGPGSRAKVVLFLSDPIYRPADVCFHASDRFRMGIAGWLT